MDPERWRNVTEARQAHELGSPTVAAGPLELIVEISARCNLRCQMCAINYDARHQASSGRPALFKPALFERLRPMFPTLLRAHLYGLGEPVLNPHLAAYIEELSDAGVRVWFTTNATLIDDAMAEAFARAGAERISVSVDGATAETFETIRRGATFDSVLRGIRALCAARDRRGNPTVTVNFVAMASNLHELPALVDLCAELGVEEMNVEPLFYWGDESPELAEHYRRESLAAVPEKDAAECLDTAVRRAAEAGLYLSSRFRTSSGSFDYRKRVLTGIAEPRWLCSEPWATVFVTAAGEVRTCCLNGTVFGNLLEQGFEEIWNGPAYRAFRGQHVGGEVVPTGCGTCMSNGRKRHSEYFAAVEPVSYRPLLELSRQVAAEGRFHLDRPADGEVVTDPLVVTGRLDPPLAARLSGHLWRPFPRLLVDHTPIGFLPDAIVDRGRFAVALPLPYANEGAHVLSLRDDAGSDLGWGRRTVHLWRAAGSDGPTVVAHRALVEIPLRRRARHAEVRLDGRPWPAAEWLCGRRNGTWRGAAVVDLRELPAGPHHLEVRPAGAPPTARRLEKLPV